VGTSRIKGISRHGTTTLFAALNAATGKVIGQLHRRHRAKEFLEFLLTIEDVMPAKREVYLVLDLSEFLCSRHIMTYRSRYAEKEEI
jgi:hypothetical protein